MYFQTPNYSVAVNAQAASATLARAIIRDFWADIEHIIQTAAYPAGKHPDNLHAQFFCPQEEKPTKPVVLVVSEPVARFRATMAQCGLVDVEAALTALETNAEYMSDQSGGVVIADEHFLPQYALAKPAARVFRLEDLDAAATYIGLTLPLPVINEAPGEKPTLTPEQEARVLTYYAEDKTLYDAIAAGGMDYSYTPHAPEPEPTPAPTSITATQIRLWLVRNGISMEQVSAAIAAIPDAQARAEAEVLWEYAPYVERTNPLVAMIATGFNMDDAAIDQAFREAEKL